MNETTVTRKGQMRLKGTHVHVQVYNNAGGYAKFDVPANALLSHYIKGEVAAGHGVLSLAGEGNSNAYVPVDVVLRRVTKTEASLSIPVTIAVAHVEGLDAEEEDELEDF